MQKKKAILAIPLIFAFTIDLKAQDAKQDSSGRKYFVGSAYLFYKSGNHRLDKSY